MVANQRQRQRQMDIEMTQNVEEILMKREIQYLTWMNHVLVNKTITKM